VFTNRSLCGGERRYQIKKAQEAAAGTIKDEVANRRKVQKKPEVQNPY